MTVPVSLATFRKDDTAWKAQLSKTLIGKVASVINKLLIRHDFSHNLISDPIVALI